MWEVCVCALTFTYIYTPPHTHTHRCDWARNLSKRRFTPTPRRLLCGTRHSCSHLTILAQVCASMCVYECMSVFVCVSFAFNCLFQ
jgi:hypothetical protein